MGTHLPSFAAILPAAGTGKRFGGGDKLLMDLGGQTVLQRSVALFARREDVGQIVIPTAPDRLAEYRAQLTPVIGAKELTLVPGGRERWESVLHALRAVRGDIAYVGIHDAARPLAPDELIAAAFAGAVAVGGSVPCLAEPATLKRMGPDGNVFETVLRAGLYQAQTPQCFARRELIAAFEKLLAEDRLADVTDDAQVFERVGRAVKITPGSARNLKITTAEDLELARSVFSL